MAATEKSGRPRLWISYPWTSKEERDFTYLVGQLKEANIEATYDSLQLQPGTPLGQRIVQRLISIDFDGWLYILTYQCLTRRTYADELAAALAQTLKHMGADFPMAGLLHGIGAQQVPPTLRVRPCLSLADPDWKTQVAHTLKCHEPRSKAEVMDASSRFIWRIHPCYGGDHLMTAIEVRSPVESIQYWRFAVPKPIEAVRWGQGVAGGGEVSRIKFAVAKGSAKYGDYDVSWFGAANAISNTESAYAVFAGQLPDFICFGPAKDPLGPPGQMEVYRTRLSKH
ncbi:MAG TPA: hypothetical protein VE398_00195 [Acidobacteriota bacterium]|nr:hypothetical protein [Acidobacteriota bacterium]